MKRMIGGMLCILLLVGCSSNLEEELFNEFSEKLVTSDYEGLYQLLSQESQAVITEEEFVARYTTIYSDIGASQIVLVMPEVELENNIIPFTLTMNTIAGEVNFDFELPFIEEEGKLRVVWSESLIFPMMESGDEVRFSSLHSRRGSILDRNGFELAADVTLEEGALSEVGIWPARFDEALMTEVAKTLDISEEVIMKRLEANTDPDDFVHIVNSLTDSPKVEQLLTMESVGIIVRPISGRIYQDHEGLGRLLGFVEAVTAEDLEADEEGIYTAASIIGRAGLEQVYETTLRGIDGIEIFIRRDGANVGTIAIREPQHGDDIKMTIDPDLQIKVYEAMKGEDGSAAAVDPTTGEVLALVSSPSYNSNLFSTYMTQTEAALWEEREVAPRNVLNRFANPYSPGSTFKLHTAAIGLENGTLDPDEIKNIQGREWSSGNHIVTRWFDFQTRIGLREAVKFSDNIYFAMEAQKIGRDKFLEGMDKFTIGTELNIGFPLGQSQIANANTLESEALLIDTGFGQGEILATTLNIALDYSLLSNNRHPGSIMNPTLIFTDDFQPSILKEAIVTQENLAILQEVFLAVVEDSDGTGHGARMEGVRLAGKTGTAETNAVRGERGVQHGWFVATDLDSASISLAVMIEDAQDSMGGTLGVVEMVREVLGEYLK